MTQQNNTKNVYLAGILNFFLVGPGYIYQGKRTLMGLLLTIGAILATYVELQLQEESSPLYWIMFAAFFLLATATTIDVVQDIRKDNNSTSQ